MTPDPSEKSEQSPDLREDAGKDTPESSKPTGKDSPPKSNAFNDDSGEIYTDEDP